jgi:hypothetical protein
MKILPEALQVLSLHDQEQPISGCRRVFCRASTTAVPRKIVAMGVRASTWLDGRDWISLPTHPLSGNNTPSVSY